MEKAIRFLGLCILVSVIIICSTILLKSFVAERYYLGNGHNNYLLIFDRIEGTFVDPSRE